MVLYGTIVDGVLIVIGSLLGLCLTKIPERFKETIIQGIALTVILIGLDMALQTENVIIVLISMLIGGMIGEFLRIEDWLTRFSAWIESKFATRQAETSLSQGFITATLIFVIGAMAIIGALDSGLRGNHEVLLTKGLIDGFTSLVLSATLGIGVLFSVIPVVLYQGTIALLATQIGNWFSMSFLNGFIAELTAVGGLLIVAIGLNLLKLTQIRIGNLLPSIIVVLAVYSLFQLL